MGNRTVRGVAGWVAAAGIAATMSAANAQTPAPTAPAAGSEPAETPTTSPAAAATEAPPPGLWVDGIHLSAQLDAGIIANPFRPATGLNWGQLFTDHANQVQLNQLLLTANKPLDPKNSDYQWGFKVQFMYGDRKSTRLNSSHPSISYAVFCLKKKKKKKKKENIYNKIQ